MHLSVVRHIEGTMNTGRQIFNSSYEESDAKQLFQKGRWELSLQLLIGVQTVCIQEAARFQEPERLQNGQIDKQMQ